MIAVRRTAADEAAAMIDAMDAARKAVSRAKGAVFRWFWRVRRTEGLRLPSVSVGPAYTAADRAFRESVEAVCALRGQL